MNSLEVTDQASAKVAVAPRVTLQQINDSVAFECITTGAKATVGTPGESMEELKILTICILVMNNGFTIVGKSAPASPANFNAELGAQLAREDAVRQVWPLMGFSLRDSLANQAGAKAA